ncbi:MAG TPA: AraD1 family protein [Verrucomicrobiae bacterium]|nr:AraD1 family protein [Verrucomicrobiae bacterium]
MTRLVQIQNGALSSVAVVEEPRLHLLGEAQSIYELAESADLTSRPLKSVIQERLASKFLDYDSIYEGKSEWRLLPPIHHPRDAASCLVSGTGLTHLGSANDRQAMHGDDAAEETDSLRMFRLGVAGGKPPPGQVGVAPEWFYKGTGTILRGHGDPLDVPPHAEDGGEEGEIAGVYYVDENGSPRRIGFAVGNEFSDHAYEKENYLHLAGSKLRTCSLGPELVIDAEFESIAGRVSITRGGDLLWAKDVLTGEKEMCHSLANLEHHHFKFDGHRRPGDLHVHFFGACALSFGAGIKLANGDVMEISFAGFGRPLRNTVRIAKAGIRPIIVKTL